MSAGILVAAGFLAFHIYINSNNIVKIANIDTDRITKIEIGYGPDDSVTLTGDNQIDGFVKLMNSTVVRKQKVPVLSNGMGLVVQFYYGNNMIPAYILEKNSSLVINREWYDVVMGPLNADKIKSYYKSGH